MPKQKHLLETGYYLPYNPELKQTARELRQNQTPAEKKLWNNYFKTFKYRVVRQRPIDYFIVDFYCAALKLVIEVDGESHFTNDSIAYDLERTQLLEGYGLKVIRFTNDEVMKTFEGVCARIEELVNNI
ncbi:hypothetical protein CAL7716_037910 [Calothrix sp. PCC 7716]|nr:hypothetical protein CAL7716_037910 [Calothrix sp. PCC 7716]